MSLAAGLGQLSISLFLRPAAHTKPWDMWRYQSPPSREDWVQSHETRGSVGALLSGEAGSRAVGHEAASKPSSSGRWVPYPLNMWQHALLLVLASWLYMGVPGI
jgi:hypothetical protein